MVEETIRAIRETEKKAEKIVEEAGRESERLLAEAKEKAAEPPPFPLRLSAYRICTICSHRRICLVSIALLSW